MTSKVLFQRFEIKDGFTANQMIDIEDLVGQKELKRAYLLRDKVNGKVIRITVDTQLSETQQIILNARYPPMRFNRIYRAELTENELAHFVAQGR